VQLRDGQLLLSRATSKVPRVETRRRFPEGRPRRSEKPAAGEQVELLFRKGRARAAYLSDYGRGDCSEISLDPTSTGNARPRDGGGARGGEDIVYRACSGTTAGGSPTSQRQPTAYQRSTQSRAQPKPSHASALLLPDELASLQGREPERSTSRSARTARRSAAGLRRLRASRALAAEGSRGRAGHEALPCDHCGVCSFAACDAWWERSTTPRAWRTSGAVINGSSRRGSRRSEFAAADPERRQASRWRRS
jgi:hypothetical protein